MWNKEQVIQELKQSGKRITKQRELLIDVILQGNWNCCKEIYYEVSKLDPSIGLATVYRMISTLEEIGAMGRSYQYLPSPGSCKYVGSEECDMKQSGQSCSLSIVNQGISHCADETELYLELKTLLKKRGYLDKEEFCATIVIDEHGQSA